MNDWTPLEGQLQSWTPRRPAARLEEVLFGDGSRAGAARRGAAHPAWVWLAPAACLLTVALFLNLRLARTERTSWLTATAGSNILASLPSGAGMAAPIALSTASQGQNTWSELTIDWTRAGRYLSTTGSFRAWHTNIQKL